MTIAVESKQPNARYLSSVTLQQRLMDRLQSEQSITLLPASVL